MILSAGYRLDYELTKNTTYLAIMAEPWSVLRKMIML